jgi:hypothetical protein
LDLAGNRADEASVVALLSAHYSGYFIRVKALIVGGNKGGSDVEAMVKRVKEVRPEIDIARDRLQKQNAE